MEWRDEGIILATRRHGETSVILEVMTRERGRHLGVVRGGRSRRMRPFLQPGNRVDLTWRARLDEHMGAFQAEPIEQNAARLLDSATAVHGLQTLAAHLRLLPERDPHGRLYETLGLILAHLDDPTVAGALVARFEIMVLDELGFGLDLVQCGATGTRDNLIYVSPKTGRAISAEAGTPWADRLLPLPNFLKAGAEIAGDGEAVSAAFRLSGFFLSRHVYEPRGITAPESRASFLAALLKALDRQANAGLPTD
jgi:DNA repair protein RecO (recombination protein O)